MWLLSSEESDSVTLVVSTLVQCRSAPFMWIACVLTGGNLLLTL